MLIKDLFKNYIYPVAVLSGGILGVGIFSLPYIALKSGIWLALIYLIVLSGIVMIINSIVGEIALKTPDFKRIPGFLGFHLGNWAKIISLITSILGGFGVLLVYLIVGGNFLSNALSPVLGGENITYVFVYFIVAVTFICFDIKAITKIELGAIILLILTFLLILLRGFSSWHFSNILATDFTFTFKNIFLPYGPIIFSLWGVGLIPEVEEMMRGNKRNIKKMIIASVLIITAIYLMFIFLTLGITGANTTDSALEGLKNVLGGPSLAFALFAGAVVTLNAFVSLGLIMKKVLMYDIGIKKLHAIIIACFVPMILFLLGMRSFISIISFIGGIFLGIDGILILLMYKKIGGKSIIIYILSAAFLLGIIYEIIYFIK